MKKSIIIIILSLGFLNPIKSQTIIEADIPAIKEIQATIISLLPKAALNFEDMKGEEVLKEKTITMYKASPTATMHAQQYYLTYVVSNQKSYYMSYYTNEHDLLLATTAVMTMNAYAGEKWQTKAEEGTDPNISTTNLYCAGVKLATMRLDKKEKSIALSIGFFSDPGSGTSFGGK